MCSSPHATVVLAALCWLSCAFAPRLAARAERAAQQYADVILRGGAIHTMDPSRPLAQAVAIAQGRILAVGGERAIAQHAGPKTRIVELEGRMVLPGLHDAHMHPMSAGVWLLRCRLNDALNAAELRRTIKNCAAKSSAKEWFIARGWRDDMLERDSPARAFEGIVEQRPAMMLSAQGERMWLNARAFDAVGLDHSEQENVAEGIERDSNGRRTGFVNGAAAAGCRDHLQHAAWSALHSYPRACKRTGSGRFWFDGLTTKGKNRRVTARKERASDFTRHTAFRGAQSYSRSFEREAGP